jgi:hypothetical protein
MRFFFSSFVCLCGQRRLQPVGSLRPALDVTRCAGIAKPGEAALELQDALGDGDKLLDDTAARSDDA